MWNSREMPMGPYRLKNILEPIRTWASPRLRRGPGWPSISYSLLALSTLLLVAACSSGKPSVSVPSAPSVSPVTITHRASASVLITSDAEESAGHVQSLEVSPRSIVVDQEESLGLSARAFDLAGQTLDDVEFIWTLSDPRAGVLTRKGGFRSGRTPGIFTDAISVVGVQNTPAGVRHASA